MSERSPLMHLYMKKETQTSIVDYDWMIKLSASLFTALSQSIDNIVSVNRSITLYPKIDWQALYSFTLYYVF